MSWIEKNRKASYKGLNLGVPHRGAHGKGDKDVVRNEGQAILGVVGLLKKVPSLFLGKEKKKQDRCQEEE